jgi:hypothetical protein
MKADPNTFQAQRLRCDAAQMRTRRESWRPGMLGLSHRLPGLLAAASWVRVISRLETHYRADSRRRHRAPSAIPPTRGQFGDNELRQPAGSSPAARTAYRD